VNDHRTALARSLYRAAHLTGTFILRSGATSDEYFDKYRFESDPALLRAVGAEVAALVPGGVDALAGLELGGVPVAVAASQASGLPALFVRKAAKEYGTCRLAEGGEVAGRRLVVVEDVVTSGGQILASTKALRELGATVDTVVCVIDRESGGAANLAAAGLDLRPVFTMTELLAVR
jgi:orotate phosphoribosyltransferase